MYKIIILEDNLLMQDSLKEVLLQDSEISIAGMYSNAKDIVRIYAQTVPDLVITDIDMPEQDGLAGLAELKKGFPEAKVMVFTVFEDNDKVLGAICRGADGYILKSSEPKKIVESVKDLINGGTPLTPIIASKILRYFPKKSFFQENNTGLTAKEKEVLHLLTKGHSYKMIAGELGKSTETVKAQVKSIYRKLNVKSNAEAIIKAMYQEG